MEAIIRKAESGDSEFVGKTVLEAIDIDSSLFTSDKIMGLCSFENSIYYYGNAKICEINGKIAGCIIAYKGEEYSKRRQPTFDFIFDNFNVDLNYNPHETEKGEFYIDSMYVLPDFRGMKIGNLLISNILNDPDIKGRITLMADCKKERLVQYYEKMGFVKFSKTDAFGSTFWKMVYEKDI